MAKMMALATATLLAASPAVAQNTTETANAADVAADTNTPGTTDLNVTAVPETPTTETTPAETAPGPAPAEKGFPWGVLGLLGLLGLLPRMRRG
jgi:hypothetical protein